MFIRMHEFNNYLLLLGLVLILALAACTPGVAESEDPTPEVETATPVIEVPQIEATQADPVSPPTALFVSLESRDAGFNPAIISQLENRLETLSAESGLELVVLDTISPEAITTEVQVVIGVGANHDLNGLAAGFPGVQFLAIGDPGASIADNLSVIGDPSNEIRQKAFIAGYATALISVDFKIAGLIPADVPDPELVGQSFVIGGRHYCGICQPLFPPYNAFPQWETMTAEPGQDGFRPAINRLENIGVDVVYVHGDLAAADLLDYLEELGINVVSNRHPDRIRNNWVGTVSIDLLPALEVVWSDLVAGNPGVQISGMIRVLDTENGLLSAGRLRFLEEVAEELQAGMISFENVP